MAEIILTGTACADLVDIGDYGEAQFGRMAADAFRAPSLMLFERLATYPRSGAARPDFGKGIRCLVCNRHRILYRVSGDTVQILRILQHSRDVSRHLPT